MVENHPIRVNAKDKLQQEVMRKVLAKLQDTPYVLKGGAALLFTRGLDRHTTDLDFDSSKPLNIEKRLREGLREAGVEVLSLKAVKKTDTVQRFKVHYRDPQSKEDVLFKIETSFRTVPDPETVELVNGIRTYKTTSMFEQKLFAAQSRTQARDLYDLTYLIRRFGESLSTDQIERADKFSEDIDDLVNRYANSFKLSATLVTRTTIDDTVLFLREAIEKQLRQREALVQQHNVKALAKECFDYLKLAGTPKNGGLEYKGNHYIFRSQAQTISITSTDGRGEIFRYNQQNYTSNLTADDISTLNQLPALNTRLRKKQQRNSSQGRSR